MKYLVSLYFDENTNKQIYRYMKMVAEVTGNDYMLANHVSPHITVSSFELEEAPDGETIETLEHRITAVLKDVMIGEIQWVGSGAFMSSVLYLTPVPNAYLQEIMKKIYDAVAQHEDVVINKFYRPFQWLPHTTIGKKMTPEELAGGFAVVQNNFHILQGRIVRIGLAQAGPYEEIAEWKLK